MERERKWLRKRAFVRSNEPLHRSSSWKRRKMTTRHQKQQKSEIKTEKKNRKRRTVHPKTERNTHFFAMCSERNLVQTISFSFSSLFFRNLCPLFRRLVMFFGRAQKQHSLARLSSFIAGRLRCGSFCVCVCACVRSLLYFIADSFLPWLLINCHYISRHGACEIK